MFKLVVFLLFVPVACFAQPNITGGNQVIADGQLFLVAGDDFGLKSPAAPLLYDGFERGGSGEPGDPPGYPNGDYTRHKGVFSTTSPYSGNYCTYDDGGTARGFVYNWGPGHDSVHGRYAFLCFKYRLVGSASSYYAALSKVSRLHSARHCDPEQKGAPNISIGVGRESYSAHIGICQGCQSATFDDCVSGPGSDYDMGEWRTHSLWYHVGGDDQANGEQGWQLDSAYSECMNHDGNGTINYRSISCDECGLDDGNGPWYTMPQYIAAAYFYGYCSEGDAIKIYYDDLYADNSFARVEIHYSDTRASDFEMQIPASWSDGAIEYRANQGQLAADTTYYLFVVDANGEYSNSLAISFGEADPYPCQN